MRNSLSRLEAKVTGSGSETGVVHSVKRKPDGTWDVEFSPPKGNTLHARQPIFPFLSTICEPSRRQPSLPCADQLGEEFTIVLVADGQQVNNSVTVQLG